MSHAFPRVFFQKRRMRWTIILLATLSSLSRAEDVTKVSVTCLAQQKSHGGSRYEVVGLRHTFLGARYWCKQRGGHLAFILNEEMQVFLERHLDPDEDFWFGAASSATKSSQGFPGDGERFSGKYLQKMMNFDFLFVQV